MGCAEDLIFGAGEKPVSECFKGCEGVRTGVHIGTNFFVTTHQKHIKPFSPLSEGEPFCAWIFDVRQVAEKRIL